MSPVGSSKTHPASCAPSWSRINSRVLFPAARATASVAGSVLGPASNPTSLVQPALAPVGGIDQRDDIADVGIGGGHHDHLSTAG